MTRLVAALLIVFCALSADAKQTRSHSRSSQAESKKPYCAVKDITECTKLHELEGCPKPGDEPFRFDAELNKRKNIPTDPQQPVKKTFAWMQALPKKPANF